MIRLVPVIFISVEMYNGFEPRGAGPEEGPKVSRRARREAIPIGHPKEKVSYKAFYSADF